jgi:hypothetical protein
MVFQKELYNGIPNSPVVSIVCTPLSVNVFITFATATFGIQL